MYSHHTCTTHEYAHAKHTHMVHAHAQYTSASRSIRIMGGPSSTNEIILMQVTYVYHTHTLPHTHIIKSCGHMHNTHHGHSHKQQYVKPTHQQPIAKPRGREGVYTPKVNCMLANELYVLSSTFDHTRQQHMYIPHSIRRTDCGQGEQ
jgi:hypothetical protein